MLFTSGYSSCCDKNNNAWHRELSPLRNRKIHFKVPAPLNLGEWDPNSESTFVTPLVAARLGPTWRGAHIAL